MLDLLDRQRRRVERLGYAMNCAAGWLFVACAFFVSFDVFARRFGVSSKGTTEITGYMLAFGITWGLTHALATRSHIRVDMLLQKMPLGLRAYMHAAAVTFLAVMAFFFAWRGWAMVLESWEFSARDTSALSIPLILPQGLWAIGLTVFFLLSAILLVEIALLLARGAGERVDRLLSPRTLDEETREALEAAALAREDGR